MLYLFFVKCAFCNNDETRVLESREIGDATRRRRECLQCERRFTTYERYELNLTVVKKDGTREAFDREKVEKGIRRSCEKRPISAEQIDEVTDTIIRELRQKGQNEVTSKDVGELVMKHLKKLDDVAYVRFASVYKEFADLASFRKTLKELVGK